MSHIMFESGIAFNGDIKDFEVWIKKFDTGQLKVVKGIAGGRRVFDKIVNSPQIEKFTEGMKRIKLERIDGGMRNPHIHIGNEVVLFQQEKFKELVSYVAADLSVNVFEAKGFEGTVEVLENLLT
ncbi:MAG: hypothetical protein GY765_18040 [bacterium]|nr:hypothetical protein [bacterium]